MPVATALEGSAAEDLFPLVATPAFFTDASDPSTEIRLPNGNVSPAGAQLVGIDPDLGGTGRAVVVTLSRLHLIDLDTLSQKGVPGTVSEATGVIPLDAPTTKGLALDTLRHRAFLPDYCALGAPCGADPPTLRTVNLLDGSATTFRGFPPQYRGHEIIDLTYDAHHDVVFVLTNVANAAQAAGITGGVDLHAIAGGTTLKWSHRVQDCATPLSDVWSPALGVAPTFVYFLCRGVSPLLQGAFAYSYVQHGVVRVNLGTGGTAPAAGTDEFYPFGGDLTFGKSSVDQLGQRIFVIPSGTGLRIFAFDVAHRAWSGAIPLKADSDPVGVVVDPATGRAYGLQRNSGDASKPNVYITDGRAVPLPQGLAMRVAGAADGAGLPAFDASRRHLFVPSAPIGEVKYPLAVFRDRTPLPERPAAADPDAETHDIDEQQAVQVTHKGSASAYGARVLLAGGVGGRPFVGAANASQQEEQLKFDNGDRGLYLARAGDDESPGARLSGDSTSGTSTAAATGVTVDKVTADEFATRFQEGGQNPYAALTDAADEFNAVTCQDFGEGASSQTNASSSASCAERTRAAASVSAPRSPAGLPVAVAAASATVTVTKDADGGLVSRAEAVARSVGFDVPGLGGVRIGAVRSIAESTAGGRPGTAGSRFRTVYEQVRIVDAAGARVFSCGFFGGGDTDATQPCDGADVSTAINRRFRGRVQAFGPDPTRDPLEVGSPGGAQAIVWEDLYRYWNDFHVNADARREVPGLQLVFYDDGSQASRVVVQLAAVFTESGYEIGEPFVETPTEPASLSLELLDDLGQPLAGGVFEVREDASGGSGECPSDSADSDESTATTVADDESTSTTVADDESTTTTVADEQPDDESDDGTLDECGADEDIDGDTESTTTTTSTTSTTVADSGSTTTTAVDGAGSTTTTTAADDTEDGGLVDELTDELITDGTCVTGDDGIGDCVFEGLAPGSYIVTQKASPAGYAPADDFPVTLTPGFATTVSFTNIKALATIEISLTDDADPPAALAGGEFTVVSDDGDGLLGDADVELGRCTTGADGTCEPFADVPLGAYVVHQSVAPNGLVPADDVAFTFDLPGQVAALAFVNGAPAIEATPPLESAPPAIAGGSAEAAFAPPRSSGRVTIIPPPPLPAPVVTSEPIEPDRPSGLGRVMALPAQTASFIARSPGEALLFGGIWSLLLAPAYLAARRRKLTLLKDGI